MAKQVINNGESGLIVRGKINDNFTELYTGKDSVTVANFAALPAPATATGEKWWCLASQGVYLVNRKPAGSYYSDGAAWTWLGDNPTTADQVGNVPAGGISATDVQAALNGLDTGKLNIAGTAVSATQLATGRTIAITGDLNYTSPTFNGTGNVTAAGTIPANTVTLGKMAQVATARFLGRVTAATGDVEALTGTQATTLLDVFTSALKGLVPLSGGGTTNFLRADGIWATPSGGSDPWTWIKLSADVSNSTVTFAVVTGLSFTASANTTYIIEMIATYQSAATTTGIALALDIPSGSVTGIGVGTTSGTAAVMNEQIADNATVGVTTGVRAVATNTAFMHRWIVAVGVTGGTIQLNFRSEVAASAVTMKADLTAIGYRSI